MVKNILTIFFMCIISNQAISGVTIPEDGSHPVYKSVKYVSCDTEFYQHGRDNSGKVYDEHYEEVANKSFVYALMASNAYSSNPVFIIPGWERLHEFEKNTWRGMGLIVYKSEEKKEIVLAFEGTNFTSIRDWIFGNLNIFWKGQYGDAEKVDTVDISNKYKDYKIIATGHSLGGGLALHTSLYRNNVDAYAFNTSPRVFTLHKDKVIQDDSYRLIISEDGEVLEGIRDLWHALDGINFDGPYNKFDFLNDSMIKEHGMYYIARGLTLVAASTGNPLAIDVMKRNLDCNNPIDG